MEIGADVLLDGSGTADRVNDSSFFDRDAPGLTILDDNEEDRLTGEADLDWFFATSGVDIALDVGAPEIVS